MMRVIVKNHDGDPAAATAIGDLYAPEISGAANRFLQSIYTHSKLPTRLFEAARMATARINGCIMCKQWRIDRDLRHLYPGRKLRSCDNAPDKNFYDAILKEDYSDLNVREELAISFAIRMGTEPKELSGDELFWKSVKSHLTDAEVTDLAYCIAGWMSMGRVLHVLGIDKICSL